MLGAAAETPFRGPRGSKTRLRSLRSGVGRPHGACRSGFEQPQACEVAPRDASRASLGSYRGVPVAIWEHHWAVVQGTFRSAEETSAAETAKIINSLFCPKESFGFRTPGGSDPRPKSLRSGLGRPRAACRSGFERVGAASSVRSGSAVSELSANHPVTGSRRIKKSIEVATHGLDLLDLLPIALITEAQWN